MHDEAVRGAMQATRMIYLEEKAEVERELLQARQEIQSLSSRLFQTTQDLYAAQARVAELEAGEPVEPESMLQPIEDRDVVLLDVVDGQVVSRVGKESERHAASARLREHQAGQERAEEASGRALRDERKCLTHQAARWSCAPLQGPDEFCVSVVPCTGCGDTDEHYHTSDGQSHDGPAPT